MTDARVYKAGANDYRVRAWDDRANRWRDVGGVFTTREAAEAHAEKIRTGGLTMDAVDLASHARCTYCTHVVAMSARALGHHRAAGGAVCPGAGRRVAEFDHAGRPVFEAQSFAVQLSDLRVGDKLRDTMYDWELEVVEIGQYAGDMCATCRRLSNGSVIAYRQQELRNCVKMEQNFSDASDLKYRTDRYLADGKAKGLGDDDLVQYIATELAYNDGLSRETAQRVAYKAVHG